MQPQTRQLLSSGLVAAGMLVWSGCGRIDSPGEHAHDHSEHTHSAGGGHEHGPEDAAHRTDATEGHTHVGPNGNRLIVLGEDEYHAELTVDHRRGTATVLLLDGTGRRPLAVNQKQMTLNLVLKGQPHQIPLSAAPLPTDPAAAASRFVGQDPVLREEQPLRGRLNLLIGGKPYTGQLAQHGDSDNVVR